MNVPSVSSDVRSANNGINHEYNTEPIKKKSDIDLITS